MAKMTPGRIISRTSGEDLRSRQYHAVRPGTVTDEVLLSAHATHANVGILLNKPDDGNAAKVCITGTSLWMIADSSLAAGAPLRPNTVGRGTLAVTDEMKVGMAMEPVSAANTVIEVLLTPGAVQRP
jgi:hypothetical protein